MTRASTKAACDKAAAKFDWDEWNARMDKAITQCFDAEAAIRKAHIGMLCDLRALFDELK